MNMPTRKVSITLDTELLEKLKKESERTGIKLSTLINRCLEKHLEDCK